MNKLTEMQQKVYDCLKESIRNTGYPPSVREICIAVGLASTSSVQAHLETLERKGYIRHSPFKNRSIEILEPGFYQPLREMAILPVVGKITAGAPILAVEDIEETFPVPVDYLNTNDEYFMLRVSGDSMIGRGIYDNDLVIIRRQQTARGGDMVAALIDDSATIKTYYKEKDHVILQPENDKYEPIIVKDVSIIGIVTGLFRRYR